jgi:hypothetical protein
MNFVTLVVLLFFLRQQILLMPTSGVPDPEDMDLDGLAAAAAAAAKDANPKPSQLPKFTGPSFVDLTNGKTGVTQDELLKQFASQILGVPVGHPKYEELRQAMLKTLADLDPLLKKDGCTPEEQAVKDKERDLLTAVMALGVHQATVNDISSRLVSMDRKLGDVSKGFSLKDSPKKLLEAVRTRIDPNWAPTANTTNQNLAAALELADRAVTAQTTNGINQLQQLLDEAKNKRVRKSPAELEKLVATGLRELERKAALCKGLGDEAAAGQCVAAYAELRTFYVEQFKPIMAKLGFADSLELLQRVDSPLSSVTSDMWKHLAVVASDGQFKQALALVSDKLPGRKPKNSSKYTKSSSGSSSDEDEASGSEPKVDAKPKPKDEGLRLDPKGLGEIATLLGTAIGRAMSSTQKQGGWNGGRGGHGGGGGGRGGRGGGRGDGGGSRTN